MRDYQFKQCLGARWESHNAHFWFDTRRGGVKCWCDGRSIGQRLAAIQAEEADQPEPPKAA